tara:strand:+ start:60 stop:371 length:312 start_codon:yes stop_codon:yes gene_type:complete
MNSTYTVSQSLNWFDNGSMIVRMYFLNHVPFTFDEMPDGHLYDRDLVDEADKNRDYDMEDVFQGSTYLILEGCHPCFDPIEISNRSELPEDLVPFYDEEDLGR